MIAIINENGLYGIGITEVVKKYVKNRISLNKVVFEMVIYSI